MVKKGDPELISGLAGSSLAGASPGVNNSFNLLQSLRGQQAALQTQVATDTSKYGSANPKLADERASLASLNDQIKEEVSRIGERAGNDFHAAQVVERDQQAVFEKQRRAADKLNDKAIGYTIASEDAADSRQLYETLYSRLKEAGVMEGLHSSNITVVDPGRVPAKPVRPNVPLYLAVSLCAGAFLGTCGAFFAEATDDRIQNLEMLEETLHTPILAVLPKVNKALPKKIGPKQIGSGFTTSTDRRITALEVPNSAFVEALRGLRTALMHSKRGFAPKVILVTSAAEDEGKSTVSLNLAAVLVQNDARVLLVEADMRHPALSRLFHFDNSNVIGLSNILSGSRQQPQLECFSELPNLSLLPAGPVASSPSELLGARGLRTLIEQWSAAYDYVIIDSPPILPVTDALILSRLAQLTLLVVRQGVSTRANLKRAYRMLVEDDSSHVGVVLNGIGQDSGYYRYKGSKYYTEA